MPLFIHDYIISNLAFSVLLGWNAGRNPLLPKASPEPIRIIAPIRKEVFGRGKVIQQLSGPGVVRHLTRRQVHKHGPAMTIAYRM